MTDRERLEYIFKYCSVNLRFEGGSSVNKTLEQFLAKIDESAVNYPVGLLKIRVVKGDL